MCERGEQEHRERYERQTAWCCGQPNAYCECPALVRSLAALRAGAEADRVPPMAADDPRRGEEPPF